MKHRLIGVLLTRSSQRSSGGSPTRIFSLHSGSTPQSQHLVMSWLHRKQLAGGGVTAEAHILTAPRLCLFWRLEGTVFGFIPAGVPPWLQAGREALHVCPHWRAPQGVAQHLRGLHRDRRACAWRCDGLHRETARSDMPFQGALKALTRPSTTP